MIQRIQTVYLLIALTLTAILFFVNMAELASVTDNYILTFKGVTDITTSETAINSLALTLLITVTTVVILVSIFMFKNRILQIRICGLAIGLLIGISAMIYFVGKTSANELGAELAFKWPIIAPLISLIFIVMAMRAIGKDEALVRSLNRIR
ncbi:DUF4293 domain-containing protein [Alkalitalea saponilacus]|uniref:DUF4293 family protein n=1 Tax=Alkalitalea saponilacus TaxID=889453 RepID=A0A1T5HRT4_9BACT|nr:DUF4293 domain-containing protein [Alkalitalea saponilacus]ASB50069.1 hypothetical protein CDL62_13435 [Alkalitalea saponilacus]SKC23406.1 protein of unknown function [Alkalitalea saponilacus]